MSVIKGPVVSLEGACGAGKSTLWNALRDTCRHAIPEYAAQPKTVTWRDSLPGWPASAAEEKLSRWYYADLERRVWRAWKSNKYALGAHRDTSVALPLTLRDKAFFFNIGFGLCWGASGGVSVAQATLQLYQGMVSRAEIRLPSHLVILHRSEQVRLQRLKQRLAHGSRWRDTLTQLVDVDRAYLEFLQQLEQEVYLPAQVLRISDEGRVAEDRIIRWLEAVDSECGSSDNNQVERFLRLRLK